MCFPLFPVYALQINLYNIAVEKGSSWFQGSLFLILFFKAQSKVCLHNAYKAFLLNKIDIWRPGAQILLNGKSELLVGDQNPASGTCVHSELCRCIYGIKRFSVEQGKNILLCDWLNFLALIFSINQCKSEVTMKLPITTCIAYKCFPALC